MVRFIAILTTAIMLSGCYARVDLQNAAVSQGNVNSAGAVLGTVYLYNVETGSPAVRVFDLGDLGFGVYESTSGTYSTSANRGISMEIDASVQGQETAIRAAVANGLSFSVEDYQDRRFAAPFAVLNHHWTEPRVESVMQYAGNSSYRFILVEREYRGSTLSYGWNVGSEQTQTGGSISIGGQTVDIQLLNTDGVSCSGANGVCLVTASVWQLDSSGRFLIDPENSNHGFVQSAFNGR